MNQGYETKIRAERRAGEILKEMELQKPGEYQRSQGSTVAPKLSDLGISKNQSSHWQKIAEYRLRVDRKLGAWSKGLEASHGKRTDLTSNYVVRGCKTKKDYLKEIDIPVSEMTKKEVVADIPEDVFEAYIAETKHS